MVNYQKEKKEVTEQKTIFEITMAENFPKLVRHKTIDKRNSKNTEQDKYQKKNDYWVYYI